MGRERWRKVQQRTHAGIKPGSPALCPTVRATEGPKDPFLTYGAADYRDLYIIEVYRGLYCKCDIHCAYSLCTTLEVLYCEDRGYFFKVKCPIHFSGFRQGVCNY